ncbi:MAG TPA: 2-iminoacetate synthase ThiH [Candidatus Limnocylindrales bacterium]|nr:2-iminoacetate synthase ThiH [Candidatus Limnocylindrales bacterium]
MSFVAEFNSLPMPSLVRKSLTADATAVRESQAKPRLSLMDFAHLISPAAAESLEVLSRRSHQLTQQRFGKVIRLFAPLYLSNECVNNCQYCGFSRDNPILRVTLSLDEVKREARALKEQGFRNVLLVAGEHPKFVPVAYLENCVHALHEEIPSVSLEVGPLETADYRPLVAAGADGLVVYQETYDRGVYAQMHTAGPKRNFDWRLETPERAYAAGFRRLGISPLYGLADWRYEAISVAAHADYLLRNCWKAQLTISLPRLRPCAGEFQPLTHMSDRDLAQLVCAFRLMFPDAGLVLSTREPSKLRDGLIPLGITLMSAGSHTEPGGYTGAGREKLHQTVRGRIVELGASEWAPVGRASSRADAATPNGGSSAASRATNATGQFDIADARSPGEVAELIRKLGYEPVWKDWDAALTA